MRRNMRFRVGDIILILDIKERTIKPIMWALEKAGYLRLESTGDAYKDRIYTFIKNTGIKSPSINAAEVYDHNTGELFDPKLNKEKRDELIRDTEESLRPVRTA